jgi:hypothetical protein
MKGLKGESLEMKTEQEKKCRKISVFCTVSNNKTNYKTVINFYNLIICNYYYYRTTIGIYNELNILLS